MRLNITSGDLFCEIDPTAGGSVSRLVYGDLEILRPAPPRSGPAYDPLDYGGFPMVPFIGRIFHGKFACDGKRISLPENFPPEPHAIHGHGWQSPWQVEAQSDAELTLAFHHAADRWPWSYTTRQTFAVAGDTLRVELSLTNASSSRMPAGFGWHPYFPRAGAKLIIPTTHEWHPDPDTGENHKRAIAPEADLAVERQVDTLHLDTTYTVAPQPIALEWRTHRLTLTSDPIFGHVTVYVPPRQNYFCVEPVSHAPNAVNSALPASDTGLIWLDAGAEMTGAIDLKIST